MNDFERYRRCDPLSSLQHYSWGERSMPMAVSHAMRSDMRACPTRQNRNPPPPEPETEPSNGQPRRRIAVACARCRKRKIRCSGDPGNNSGCQNCRAAGADISACQFHRVGSYTPGPSVYNYPSAMSSNPSLPMSTMFHGHSSDYSYSPQAKGLLSTRAYTGYTNLSYGDESPTDSYGYQPLPLPANDMFAGFLGSGQDSVRGWTSMGQKQTTPSAIYLDEPSPASYCGLPLPYLNTPAPRQHIATPDNLSAFSMNSLQSSLASPPAPPQSSLPSSLENRHLPIPTATRMQIAPSTELHLRAHPTAAVSLTNALPYTKASMTWNSEAAIQDPRQTASNASSACQMMTAPDVKPSLQNSTALDYLANNSPDNSSNPSSSTVYTPSSLSGATPSSLDEKYTASNAIQTSSSIREDALPRNDSTTSLAYYSTESSSSKHNTSNELSSQEGVLVSGQRYAPLQPQPQHTSAGTEQLRRNSFDQHRAVPSHRASVSSLNERRF